MTSSRELSIRDPRAFGAYLRENFIMLRRTRAEVGRELPPVQTIPYVIDADTKVLDEVKNSAAELARIILSRSEDFRGQHLQASEQLSNVLRQATGIAKAPYVADFVRILVESGQKVMLAGWHRAVYAIWEQRLKDLRLAWYTGSEPPAQKEKSKQAMVDGNADVFIISLRSGSGLDELQYIDCKTIVIGELDWSPAVHEQLIGRLCRDGQIASIAAYFLISDHGADPVMSDTLGLKREQLEGIRSPTADLVEHLQVDEDRIKKLAAWYLENQSK